MCYLEAGIVSYLLLYVLIGACVILDIQNCLLKEWVIEWNYGLFYVCKSAIFNHQIFFLIGPPFLLGAQESLSFHIFKYFSLLCILQREGANGNQG